MERSEMRGGLARGWRSPDFAALHSGYACANSGHALGPPREITASGKEAGDRNILVDLLPVQTQSAQLDALARGRGRIEQTRKPRKRHTDCAAVGQIDPHRVLVKADGGRRNGHAMPSRSGPG